MTDKMKAYTKVMQTFKEMMPTVPQNQVITIAMIVQAMVTTRSQLKVSLVV